jgi:hypothetical protein
MKYILFSAIALLAACTQMPASSDSFDRVNQEFKGQDVNNFFIDYGSPAGVVSSTKYGRIYRWISLDTHLGDSENLSHTGNYVIPNISSEGVMTAGYCEIHIRVDIRGRIEKITEVNDSLGKFSSSRCAEIFSQSQN